MINGWKTMVCFYTNNAFNEADSIEVDLPAIPHAGEHIWLTATLEEKLVNVILDNGNEMAYYPQAMFERDWDSDLYDVFKALPRKEKEKYMQFCDFNNVKYVFYDTNINAVLIVLDDR